MEPEEQLYDIERQLESGSSSSATTKENVKAITAAVTRKVKAIQAELRGLGSKLLALSPAKARSHRDKEIQVRGIVFKVWPCPATIIVYLFHSVVQIYSIP